MKKFLLALMLVFGTTSLMISEVEAKRLGGGGSFGRQAPSMTRQAPAQQPAQRQAAPASQGQQATAPGAPAPKPASPWRNILGGALLGLGLGALLSHLGIGGAFASVISTILMIALLAFAVMFIMRLLRAKNGGNGAQHAYAGGQPAARTPEIGSRLEESRPHPAAFQAQQPVDGVSNVPADFDVQPFLRNAKTYFIRLQAAWDRADINDIREFTTPEMFAELRLQIQERGASPNHTDVVSLDAELLGVETVGDDYLASVKFSGMIREAEGASPEPFTEIWNLSKPLSGQGGWVLAGIQQIS